MTSVRLTHDVSEVDGQGQQCAVCSVVVSQRQQVTGQSQQHRLSRERLPANEDAWWQCQVATSLRNGLNSPNGGDSIPRSYSAANKKHKLERRVETRDCQTVFGNRVGSI
ncbi:hypothetical protein ACRRTK_024917 [Alexandromys fortis]